jgi:pSer/pThr/pTyr-binding forkhead associated (FHA) protein
MPCSLKILEAPEDGQVGTKLPLREGENAAGRVAPLCSLVLNGGKVSKKHCTFLLAGARLTVEDNNSSNGVFVNGKKVSKQELKDKDRLVIGEFTLEVAFS